MDEKRPSPPSSALKIQTSISSDSGGGGSGNGPIIFGKYQLGRLLGRGSFAKVYRGRRLDDGSTHDVAIKVIDKNNSSMYDNNMERLIIREVSAMHRLNNHPNIIKLNEVMATKSKIYLVMELAPGGDLLSKLNRRGRFSYSKARSYFHQLVSALHFCHQNGVFHRDLKPQNLLLDKHGQLKVSDFGISALHDEQLSQNRLLQTACGTPAYLAPEIMCTKEYDGSKADAFSCGVIFFVFLTGELPFDDRSYTKLNQAKLRREYQFPDWVQKPAQRVINGLLDPNPITRLSIEKLTEIPWFKKSAMKKGELELDHQAQQGIFDQKEYSCEKSGRLMNAFDIISMSNGLDLSGLFEARSNNKKERMRFITSVEVESVEEKVMKIGKEELGYRVERRKGGGIGLVKGRVVLLVEIWEMTENLWLVDIKVVDGRKEFDETQWEVMKVGLKDSVVSWCNDDGYS